MFDELDLHSTFYHLGVSVKKKNIMETEKFLYVALCSFK